MTSQLPDNTSSRLADEALTVLAQKGDNDSADELLKRYRSFVRTAASHYYCASLETDDIVQEGLIGLLSAIYSFSAEKNAAFRTYCSACVNNRIRSVIKKSAGTKNLPLNTYIPLEDIELPGACDPESTVIAHENAANILRLIDETLSDLEKSVLRLHMVGLSNKASADSLEISEKAVDNALQRVRTKLTKALNEP